MLRLQARRYRQHINNASSFFKAPESVHKNLDRTSTNPSLLSKEWYALRIEPKQSILYEQITAKKRAAART